MTHLDQLRFLPSEGDYVVLRLDPIATLSSYGGSSSRVQDVMLKQYVGYVHEVRLS
jgi:hypothetical protein